MSTVEKPVVMTLHKAEPAVEIVRRPKSPQKTALMPSRTSINFVLDTALLVVFLAIVWSSVVLRFIFPPGTAAAGWTLWGHGFDDWSALQFSLMCIFSLGILVHLMLHWSWICGVVASRLSRWRGRSVRLDDGTQTLYGVGLLIVALNVIGFLIAAAAICIRMP